MLSVDKCSEMWYCVIKSGRPVSVPRINIAAAAENLFRFCYCCRKASGTGARITLSGIQRDFSF